MTCIVAISENKKVYIGGDSASVAGNMTNITCLKKVFRVGEFLIGYTHSFRIGQLLQYQLQPPEHKEVISDLAYLSVDFVNTLRELFREHGVLEVVNNIESGSNFLVGYRGNLYNISYDFQVNQPLEGYDSVGSGMNVALGSLFSTTTGKPKKRIKKALKAASHHVTSVRPPFVVESI